MIDERCSVVGSMVKRLCFFLGRRRKLAPGMAKVAHFWRGNVVFCYVLVYLHPQGYVFSSLQRVSCWKLLMYAPSMKWFSRSNFCAAAGIKCDSVLERCHMNQWDYEFDFYKDISSCGSISSPHYFLPSGRQSLMMDHIHSNTVAHHQRLFKY